MTTFGYRLPTVISLRLEQFRRHFGPHLVQSALNAPVILFTCFAQPEPASSQFRGHPLLTNYALGPACGGLRRPAVVSMRSYVRNATSAGAVVPMVLDKTNACQRSDCAESGSGTTLSSFALSRQELEKMDLKLCLFKVRFSSPTLELSRV